MNKLGELIDKHNDLSSKLSQELTITYTDLFVDVFKENEWLKSFSFPAYTPYFNDGADCKFMIYEVDNINGISIWDSENEDIVKLVEKSSIAKVSNEINVINDSIPSYIFLNAFGDHSIHTIEKDVNGKLTMSTDDYEHD